MNRRELQQGVDAAELRGQAEDKWRESNETTRQRRFREIKTELDLAMMRILNRSPF